MQFTPYAGVMRAELQGWLDGHVKAVEIGKIGKGEEVVVETVVDGVSGDLIVGGTFGGRIERRCGLWLL